MATVKVKAHTRRTKWGIAYVRAFERNVKFDSNAFPEEGTMRRIIRYTKYKAPSLKLSAVKEGKKYFNKLEKRMQNTIFNPDAQLLGYYSPTKKTIYIRKGPKPKSTLDVFKHELGHATYKHQKAPLVSYKAYSQEFAADYFHKMIGSKKFKSTFPPPRRRRKK